MTRRERLERRAERRREWAASRDRKSAAGFAKASTIANGIPLGQPILVGHHSERHHRADIERIDNGMRQGCESAKMAEHHRSKAAGLEAALEDSIFSDDADAVERLEEKAAAIDAECERRKAENKAFRKGPAAYAEFLGVTPEQEAARRARIMEGYSWCRQPYPTYSLANARANARRCRERIKVIKSRQAYAEKVDAAGGVLIERLPDYDTARVTFAEKPDRKIIDMLKEAGFYWNGQGWSGRLEKLPSAVADLERRAS